MQRLFSMFPEGGPGAGLLLLRLSVALPLLLHPSGGPLLQVMLALPAIGLCLGVLTPLLAVVCGLFSFYDFLVTGGATLLETGSQLLAAGALALPEARRSLVGCAMVRKTRHHPALAQEHPRG